MERKELLMIVMIGVLLLTIAVQTVALANLNNGQVTVTAKTVAQGSASSSNAAITGMTGHSSGSSSSGSLSDLPSMVGGC